MWSSNYKYAVTTKYKTENFELSDSLLCDACYYGKQWCIGVRLLILTALPDTDLSNHFLIPNWVILVPDQKQVKQRIKVFAKCIHWKPNLAAKKKPINLQQIDASKWKNGLILFFLYNNYIEYFLFKPIW